jgi:hypothetical protein
MSDPSMGILEKKTFIKRKKTHKINVRIIDTTKYHVLTYMVIKNIAW